jgi:cytochrome c oxidase subunit IV
MRRHGFDLTAFVWGVLFLLGAGAVLLDEYGRTSIDLKWLLPGALLASGIGGMANALRHSRK